MPAIETPKSDETRTVAAAALQLQTCN